VPYGSRIHLLSGVLMANLLLPLGRQGAGDVSRIKLKRALCRPQAPRHAVKEDDGRRLVAVRPRIQGLFPPPLLGPFPRGGPTSTFTPPAVVLLRRSLWIFPFQDLLDLP